MSAEQRIVDPKTGGEKGRKPERYDLLPYEALDEVARVYGMGAEKYEDWNWAKGYAWSLSLGALQRHVAAFAQGEDADPESGYSHLAHAAFHCLALITFQQHDLGTDDRWIPERDESPSSWELPVCASRFHSPSDGDKKYSYLCELEPDHDGDHEARSVGVKGP